MLLILTGPSCSGKSTIANELKTKYNFIELKSHTTRSRRNPEEDDYYYVTKETFSQIEFIECVEYAGNSYGLSVREIQKAENDPNGSYVVIVEAHGAEQVWRNSRHKVKMVKMFIDCSDSALERRLAERGIDVEARRKQWANDRVMLDQFNFIVRNEDFDVSTAVSEVLANIDYWFSPSTVKSVACDGGCQLERGCWAYTLDGKTAHGQVMTEYPTTNNVAEYLGLISLLQELGTQKASWARDVNILMDSQLVVSQVKGTFKVRKSHLKPYNAQVITLLRDLPFNVTLSWVPRENELISLVDRETKRLLS